MSPFYGLFEALVAGIAVTALFAGALGGSVAWGLRVHVVLGLVTTGIAFALFLVLNESPGLLIRLGGVGVFPLVLGFLIAQLAARHLAARTTWPFVVTMLAAFVLALCAGCAVMLLARWDLWAPLWVALAADLVLVLLWVRTRAPMGGREP